MSIKYENDVIKEINERCKITVPHNCAIVEEFEKWLREKDINLSRSEIIEDCNGILQMLDDE